MAEVFISYSQADRPRVAAIATALEAKGHDVFWDPEIPPGESWESVIQRELEGARCVIVVWSRASLDSDWVREEADYGKRKRLLVPILIDDVEPPLGFSRIQAADLRGWSGDPHDANWGRIVDRIDYLINEAEASGDSAPRRPAPEEPRRERPADAGPAHGGAQGFAGAGAGVKSNPYGGSQTAAPGAAQSLKPLARWNVILLIAQLVVVGLYLLAEIGVLVSGYTTGAYVTFSILGFLIWIPGVVVFAMWVFRAAKNLRFFGAVNLKYEPGWAVGWFFIPLANLWFSREVLFELFRAGANPKTWSSSDPSGMVQPWWLSVIAGFAMMVLHAFASQGGAYPVTLFSLLGTCAGLASTFLAITVVNQLTRAQEAQISPGA